MCFFLISKLSSKTCTKPNKYNSNRSLFSDLSSWTMWFALNWWASVTTWYSSGTVAKSVCQHQRSTRLLPRSLDTILLLEVCEFVMQESKQINHQPYAQFAISSNSWSTSVVLAIFGASKLQVPTILFHQSNESRSILPQHRGWAAQGFIFFSGETLDQWKHKGVELQTCDGIITWPPWYCLQWRAYVPNTAERIDGTWIAAPHPWTNNKISFLFRSLTHTIWLQIRPGY